MKTITLQIDAPDGSTVDDIILRDVDGWSFHPHSDCWRIVDANRSYCQCRQNDHAEPEQSASGEGEPYIWVYLTDVGTIQAWTHSKERAATLALQTGKELTPLYRKADGGLEVGRIANTQPADNFEILKKQFFSLRSLAANQEKIQSHLSAEVQRLRGFEASIESERAANSELTDEIATLRKRNEAIRNEALEEAAHLNEQCKQEICDDLVSRILSAADRAPEDAVIVPKDLLLQIGLLIGELTKGMEDTDSDFAEVQRVCGGIDRAMLAASLQISAPARELEWRDLYDLAKQAADAGSVCDHDLMGKPITHYDVMITGPYSPFLLRLINLALRKFGAPAASPVSDTECQHDWVDARNRVVTSGELCIKCYAIRPENNNE